MKQLGAWQEIVQPTTVNGASIRLPEFVLYTGEYMVSVRWNWDSSYWRARIYKQASVSSQENKLLWWILDQEDTLAKTMDAAARFLATGEDLLQKEDDDWWDARNEDWEANHG